MTVVRAHTASIAASDWVTRWAHLVAPSETVLDVACGTGRHTQLFANKGCVVTAIDISGEALAAVQAHAPRANILQADLENAPWPLPGETFDAVVVTNYLWRPLFPQLIASLRADGILIYETFTIGNETVGKPSRPDFLLQSKELLSLCAGLHVIAYEEGFLTEPSRFVQRIVATQRTTKMQGSYIYFLSPS